MAKTLAVRTLARILRLQFQRVQCTPDLMPADIVGANVFNMATGTFALHNGPVFTDLLLVDEINRMPPRTQAALLEAMEERQVTIDGTSHRLSPEFAVFATQNPVEFEGTYPLPEAELDRFLVKIRIGYPPAGSGEEEAILERHHQGFDARAVAELDLAPLDAAALAQARREARRSGSRPRCSPTSRRSCAGRATGRRSRSASALAVAFIFCSSPRPSLQPKAETTCCRTM